MEAKDNYMINLAKLAAALVGLFSLGMGLLAWFSPAQAGDMIGISASSVLGTHTIRGDVGAIFLGSALGCAIALFRGKVAGLKLPIIIYGLVLIGRLISLVLTGTGPGVIQPMVIEVVLIGLSVFAYKTLKTA